MAISPRERLIEIEGRADDELVVGKPLTAGQWRALCESQKDADSIADAIKALLDEVALRRSAEAVYVVFPSRAHIFEWVSKSILTPQTIQSLRLVLQKAIADALSDFASPS